MSSNIAAAVLAAALVWALPAAGQEWEFSTDVGGNTVYVGGADTGGTSLCWAVMGGFTKKGDVFYYDGASWAVQTALYSTQTGEHRGIFVNESGTRVWVVGNYLGGPGNISHYNGTAWIHQTSLVGGSQYLYCAYAPDPNHVWVGGNAGNIYHSANGGTAWELQTNVGAGIFVRSISGSNSENVLALGGYTPSEGPSRIYRYDGSSWSVQTEVQNRLESITVASEDGAGAGGYAGMILQYDGSEWFLATDVGDPTVNAITAGNDNDKGWAGLSSGAIAYFNGVNWSIQTLIAGLSAQGGIKSIGASEGEVWAGAGTGAIYRYRPRPPQRWLYDYNGDGTSDIAVFRSNSSLWAIRSLTRIYFGQSADKPAPGDFDGDGTTEIAVFRPAVSLWAVRNFTRVYFGQSGDTPFPADFSGDGTAEIALFRPGTRLWAIRGLTRAYFGAAGDIPVPAGYDGGGGLPGIFRPSTGLWALMNGDRYYFGQAADHPLPAYYRGGEDAQIGIFRESVGLWALRTVTRVYFGQTGDTPVVK